MEMYLMDPDKFIFYVDPDKFSPFFQKGKYEIRIRSLLVRSKSPQTKDKLREDQGVLRKMQCK